MAIFNSRRRLAWACAFVGLCAAGLTPGGDRWLARAGEEPTPAPELIAVSLYQPSPHESSLRRLRVVRQVFPAPPIEAVRTPSGRWLGPGGSATPYDVTYVVNEDITGRGKRRVLWCDYRIRLAGQIGDDTFNLPSKYDVKWDPVGRRAYIFKLSGTVPAYTRVDAFELDLTADLGPADLRWPVQGGTKPWPEGGVKSTVATWVSEGTETAMARGYLSLSACVTRRGVLVCLRPAQQAADEKLLLLSADDRDFRGASLKIAEGTDSGKK